MSQRATRPLAAAAQPAMVLLALLALGLTLPRPAKKPAPAPIATPRPSPPAAIVAVEPELEPEPEPAPPPPPQPDRAAIARAEQARDAAATARRQAEARIADEKAALANAQRIADQLGEDLRALAEQVKGPGARIEAARARGAVLKSEADKIRAELISLADAPRPRRKTLVDKTPLARQAEGPEFHFEIRGDRVAFIDVDRLVDRVKADAQLQLRMATGGGNPASLLRPIRSSVGPIGDFAMRYEIGVDLAGGLGDLVQPGRVSFSLTGWEIVPIRERRGETLDTLVQPGSDLARVVNAVDPQTATITLWVYPDGFALYRQIRDLLHDRGFQVAARPLPNGMAIRGSPNGSLSASH